jgi:hypothetical protein
VTDHNTVARSRSAQCAEDLAPLLLGVKRHWSGAAAKAHAALPRSDQKKQCGRDLRNAGVDACVTNGRSVVAGSIGSDFRALRGRFQTALGQVRTQGDGRLRQNAARQNAIKRLTRRQSIRHLVGKDQNSSTAWAKKMKPRLDWQTSLTPSRLGKCRGRSRKRA